jgi:hypothetical protein
MQLSVSGLALPCTCARIYRPSFHENKPKTLVFSHTKRAFWACFRENWVYNFGHSRLNMELDPQSLFGLLCTAVLIGRETPQPPPPHLGS